MALRFLEIRLPADVRDEAAGIQEGHEVIDAWRVPSGDAEVHRYLLESQHVEGLVDALRSRFGDVRVVVMPVEATLPREAEPTPETAPEPVKSNSRGRVSREELYEDVGDAIDLNPTFLALAGLSAIVACVGLVRDDLVAIIAAMVIAPLLGPNVALALGTTLGDLDLIRRSLKSGLAGIGFSFIVAFALGLILDVEPWMPAIAERAAPDFGHLALALASGVAGGLAFTTGIGTSLIGVMVAVALLPPLAAAALLMGSGHVQESYGALVLLGTNLVAVNLGGIGTFLAQGIRPVFRTEKERAKRAARRALLLWTLLLAAFAFVLTRLPRGL